VKSTRNMSVRLMVVVFAIALIAAACGSSGSKGATPPKNGSTATTVVNVPTGGKLTIGAEEQPKCMDWLDQCSGSSWGTWIAQIETVPFVFRTVPTGAPNSGNLQIVPGPVLTGEPTFTTSPVETITYPINPAAVWSDGVPITCDDFAYTVNQQQTSKNLYDPTGYTDIDKVDCKDEHKAVVMYAKGKTFASWKLLFAGQVGLLPSHILKGKDRDALMKNGYSWSGGPWLMKWHKGSDVTLTQNPRYWGPKPKLDTVVFKFITDTAAEFQDIKSHQVDAIYPQPEVDDVNEIASGQLGDLNSAYNSNTAAIEALWINNAAKPFDTVPVRQAFAYAIDRAAVVKRLFGPLGVTQPSNSLNPYAVQDYSDQNAFAEYKLDLNKVNQLMTGAGWAKGSDGVWAKSGERAEFTMVTTQGDKRRELTEQILQPMMTAAGFKMTIKNQSSDDLFGDTLYGGHYQVALYTSSLTSLTPGLCNLFCSANIPSDANGQSGNNTTFTNIKGLDSILETTDVSLDESARMSAAKQADDILATNVASLPIDPLPDILLWSKRVVGPIQDNSIEGMFWNLEQWGVTS
jgi:peptide/nickel transport system substrate-binding protein